MFFFIPHTCDPDRKIWKEFFGEDGFDLKSPDQILDENIGNALTLDEYMLVCEEYTPVYGVGPIPLAYCRKQGLDKVDGSWGHLESELIKITVTTL